MEYLEIQFTCNEDLIEILIAELNAQSYESFWETDAGFNTYILHDLFNQEELDQLIERYQAISPISYRIEKLKEKNWNEEWEKNYDPIIVEDQILIKASFHSIAQNYPFEITIDPRMSFGTGHHATTHLMLQYQLEEDHNLKSVLDLGSGTGILSIMAHKKGASQILALDNNDWAVENSIDNIVLNHAHSIHADKGTITDVPTGSKFDIILANINKNVLLEEAEKYIPYLAEDGFLILSGFYLHDKTDIVEKIKPLGWIEESFKCREDWVAVKFVKQ